MAIGRITPRSLSADGSQHKHRYRNVVRAAQTEYYIAPQAHLVDADDLPQRKDAVHFTMSMALGRRFVDCAHELYDPQEN